MARAHAIMRNRRYSTANSSETEFNVDALLKTTTGMTLDDLGQSMRSFKSTRKKRALGASLDVALSQFPSEDGVSIGLGEMLFGVGGSNSNSQKMNLFSVCRCEGSRRGAFGATDKLYILPFLRVFRRLEYLKRCVWHQARVSTPQVAQRGR